MEGEGVGEDVEISEKLYSFNFSIHPPRRHSFLLFSIKLKNDRSHDWLRLSAKIYLPAGQHQNLITSLSFSLFFLLLLNISSSTLSVAVEYTQK